MTTARSIEELDGIRVPTQEEIARIGRYMRCYYQDNDRLTRILMPAFLVLGLLLVCGVLLGVAKATSQRLAFLLLGLILLGVGISGMVHLRTLEARIRPFEQGAFHVVNGSVGEISPNLRYPGIQNVRFVSAGGIALDGYYEARQEELQLGTPLLLVFIKKDEWRFGDFQWVFTPFMLTEEGIKKHR